MQFLSRKGYLPSLLPIVVELGRGGWEPLKKTAQSTNITDRGVEPQDQTCFSSPTHPSRARESQKQQEREVALGAHETSFLPPATSPTTGVVFQSQGELVTERTPTSLNHSTKPHHYPKGANSPGKKKQILKAIALSTGKQKKVPYQSTC